MFGTPVPFHEAYPTIADLRILVEEEGYMVSRKQTWTMTKTDVQQRFPCGNVSCHGGGINIEPILHNMVDEGLTNLDTGVACKGKEGSPKGRIVRRQCMNIFHVTIELDYEADE